MNFCRRGRRRIWDLLEFYILEEGAADDTVILYNPKRIGRGIFFDGRKMKEGRVEISYNIPTTTC